MSQPCDRIDDDGRELVDSDIADERLPAVETQAQAFEQVAPLAREIPQDEVEYLPVSARIAFVNARDGYEIIAPHLATIRTLCNVDVDAIERVPKIASGLLFAERRLTITVPAKKSDLVARMTRGRWFRAGFLHQAKAAAIFGLLPEEPVDRIASGRGDVDAVEDIIALVALFRQHEPALKNRMVVTPEMLDEAERLAAGLQEELRPKGALSKAKSIDAEIAAATLDRNRLWTLLKRSYAELQRVAAFLGIGPVPSLYSRQALKRRTQKQAEAS